MLELEALIQTTQALTFRAQKKWVLELKQLWFGFCKTQTTFRSTPAPHSNPTPAPHHGQRTSSECVNTAHALKRSSAIQLHHSVQC